MRTIHVDAADLDALEAASLGHWLIEQAAQLKRQEQAERLAEWQARMAEEHPEGHLVGYEWVWLGPERPLLVRYGSDQVESARWESLPPGPVMRVRLDMRSRVAHLAERGSASTACGLSLWGGVLAPDDLRTCKRCARVAP